MALHVVLAGLLFAWLRGRGLWLLAGEAGLVLSILLGAHLFRALFGPLELVRTGVQFIAERDFSSRLREVGQPELDALVAVYNRMIDSLREERLRAQEQHHFLEEVVRASPAGILTFDFDGRLTTANPGAERLLMRPAADLLGLPLDELPVPFVARVVEPGAGRVGGPAPPGQPPGALAEVALPGPWLLADAARRRGADRGAAPLRAGRVREDHPDALPRDRQLDRGGASLLESGLHYKEQIRPEDRADFETALSVANTRLRHLNAFVREYAEVVRLPPPHLTPCDLGRLVEQVALLFRRECEGRGIGLSVVVEGNPEPVSLDEHQMEQVLVNVLRNAVEAVDHRGSVAVRLGKAAGRPVLTVEDSGPGIPADVQAALFTPFFSTKANGRGIGLTLAQEILGQHGVGFSLESRAGEPTRFTIRF